MTDPTTGWDAADTGAPADERDWPEASDGAEARVRARLAAAVSGLDELVDLPVSDHVERYDALNGELQDALASIDEV